MCIGNANKNTFVKFYQCDETLLSNRCSSSFACIYKCVHMCVCVFVYNKFVKFACLLCECIVVADQVVNFLCTYSFENIVAQVQRAAHVF